MALLGNFKKFLRSVAQKIGIVGSGSSTRGSKKHPGLLKIEPKKWEFNGERKTAEEWAIKYGIPVSTMRHRLNRYNAPEIPAGANTKGCIKPATQYEYNGEKKTIAEWAKVFGVEERTLRTRVKKYGSIAPREKIIPPVPSADAELKIIISSKGQYVECGNDVIPLNQFAKDRGISFNTLYGRIRQGATLGEILEHPKATSRDYKATPPVRAKLWSWNGESLSASSWAKRYNISERAMRVRLKETGCPLPLTANNRNKFKAKPFTWNGETLSVCGWAHKYGVSVSTMSRRLSLYNSPEGKDGKLPPKKVIGIEKTYTWNGKTKTTSEWAKAYNCSSDVIRKRFKKYGCPELPQKPASLKTPKQRLQKDIFWYANECHDIDEWARITKLPVDIVESNFNNYGQPTKPEDAIEGTTIETEYEKEIDDMLESSSKKGTSKRENISALLKKIKDEPDDGLPLRETLGIPTHYNALRGIVP